MISPRKCGWLFLMSFFLLKGSKQLRLVCSVWVVNRYCYILTQIRFPTRGERVTCRSVGQNALQVTRSGNDNLNLRASWHQANNFFVVCFYFSVERYKNKTLNDWTRGKQWVLFAQGPWWSSKSRKVDCNIKGLGRTKLSVSPGASH